MRAGEPAFLSKNKRRSDRARYIDGAFWVADNTRTGSPFSQNGLPPYDMRDFLDRFYENPSNRRVLIRDVFQQLNAKER